jgi:hypothetical protein
MIKIKIVPRDITGSATTLDCLLGLKPSELPSNWYIYRCIGNNLNLLVLAV